MRSRWFSIAALGATFSLSGCRGCSEDRPYTPFGTTTALPAAEPSAPATSSPSASGSAAPVVEKSVLAPRNSRTWDVAGRTLTAPDGYVFDQGVHGTFGGADEVVAWLEADGADAAASPAGALWVFPASGEPRLVVPLPGFVPSGPGCKLATVLARTGPHSLTLDVRGDCQGALIARSPVRALVVVAPDADTPELLSLRVAAPAPGETLELAATTADRDGDGRDDIAVEASVGVAGRPALGVPLVWLDRAAGRSRDTSTTQAALVRLAQREAARAKTKKVAAEVVENVATLRRAMASVCAEGATPRLLDVEGNPLACGSLSVVVEALASAEVTAELTQGHVEAAFGALARDGWYFGKTSPSVHQKLERQLFDAVTPLTAVVTVLEPRPHAERAPRLSPLAFDAAGGLVVQTFSGPVRVEPDGSSPTPLAGTPSRPLDVFASPGHRFGGMTYSCDRSEVTLTIEGAAPLVTNLLSPRPGVCGHAPFFSSDVPPVLAAGGGHVVAIVGGAVVGDGQGTTRDPGSARSANGAWLAVPTAYGVLIDGPAHKLVNLGTSVANPLALTDCVVNDAGDAAACVHKNQALLIRTGAAASGATHAAPP